MKKLIFVFLVTLFLSVSLSKQVTVKIIVTTNNFFDSSKVYITGNDYQLGQWNPGIISLNKINDTTWSKSFDFPLYKDLEFKFTKGSWENEALDINGKNQENIKFKVIQDTSLFFRIDKWGHEVKLIKGQITGNVKYHLAFKGKDIAARDIIVWLPPSYDSLPNKKYPVLYMQDGQNIIDPKTSAFGIDWEMDETADSLITSKQMQEIIIVGIYNTKFRSYEYLNSDSGNAYISFILNKLKPFIDSTYRTLAESKNTAIGGSSSAGLISFLMVWEHPDIFSKAICFSPAFKIDDIDYVSEVQKYTGASKKISVYIYNGGMGLEVKLQPGIDEMIEVLEEKGFIENREYFITRDKLAEHNETAWAKQIAKALKSIFPYK